MLCPSGAGDGGNGFVVLGTATISSVREKDELDDGAWQQWVRCAACVGTAAWPPKYSFLWELTDVQAFDTPVLFKCNGGVWPRYCTSSWVEGDNEP